jgi:hypothetical protein
MEREKYRAESPWDGQGMKVTLLSGFELCPSAFHEAKSPKFQAEMGASG